MSASGTATDGAAAATATATESSWGYIADDVMADADRRAAVVDERRLYLLAQMKKHDREPVGDVVVTRLEEKAGEAPAGCSGYRFEISHRRVGADTPAARPRDAIGHVTSKSFVTRAGTEYVREDEGEPRPSRPGERYAHAAEVIHGRRWPFGRQYARRF